MSDITSRPYRPTMACERCCFNRGEHAEFCPWRVQFVEGSGVSSYFFDPEAWLRFLEVVSEDDATGESLCANVKEKE